MWIVARIIIGTRRYDRAIDVRWIKLTKARLHAAEKRTVAVEGEAETGERAPTFRVARRMRDRELADVLQTIQARVAGLLKRRQMDDQAALEDMAARSPELASAQAASIQGRLAFGPRRGQRVTRLGRAAGPGTSAPFTQPSRPDCAAHDGFSLHAGVCVTGTDREGLERLCRYVARPAIATERLSELPDGEGSFEDFCDGDGILEPGADKDETFMVRMKVIKKGDTLTVDFEGSDPQVAR